MYNYNKKYRVLVSKVFWQHWSDDSEWAALVGNWKYFYPNLRGNYEDILKINAFCYKVNFCVK